MIPTPHAIVQEDENRWYVLDSKHNIIAIAVDETQAADWASKMLSKNKAEERRKKGAAK